MATERTLRRRARFGVLAFGLVALMAVGATLTQAAPPFTTTLSVDNVSDLTVTVSGDADSPSKANHHIVIDWGDGSEDVLPNFTTDAPWAWGPVSHTYAAGGDYDITATLIHATPQGNDKGSATASVTVAAPSVVDDNDDDTDVLGKKVTRRSSRLATTGPETVGLAAAGAALLAAGIALRWIGARRDEELGTIGS